MMTSKKNDTKSTTSNRDAALAALASATEREAEALADWRRITGGNPIFVTKTHADRLVVIVAEKALRQAEDATRAARAEASAVVDAAEVASGDDLAIARDAVSLHADLIRLQAEEERLRAELAGISGRWSARIAQAHEATTKLAARRQEQGLPPPTRLPTDAAPKEWLAALEASSAHVLGVGKNAGRIQKLEHEERETRATIEVLYREEQKRAADREAEAKEHERQRKADAKRATEEHEAWVAKVNAAQAEKDELVAAQRAREQGQ